MRARAARGRRLCFATREVLPAEDARAGEFRDAELDRGGAVGVAARGGSRARCATGQLRMNTSFPPANACGRRGLVEAHRLGQDHLRRARPQARRRAG